MQAAPRRPAAAASAFVGRGPERAAIVAALAAPPALVLVEGDAGIGKTRLVAESLAAASLPPGSVLEAVSPPLREPFPLGAIVDALQRRWRHVGEVSLSPLAGALRPLFPEWATRLPPLPESLDDPRATRHRLLRAIIELLERLGVGVLVLEDAHWADNATVELLLQLAAAGSTSLVVTYRPTDLSADSLLPRLLSQSRDGLTRVVLAPAPFDLAETRSMIASIFGDMEIPPDFVDLMHDRTQGLPLALEESLLLLLDRGELHRQDGQWTRGEIVDLHVPRTVRDSVLERVDRLDPPARRMLQAAAVLAEPVDEALLTSVADLTVELAGPALAAALGSGLLREQERGRYALRHPLAARAVVESLPVADQRRLHQLAGRALEQLANPPVVRLSHHYRQAGDLAAARRFVEAAADVAYASGDDRTAVALLLAQLSTDDLGHRDRVQLARKLGGVANDGTAAVDGGMGAVTDALRRVLAASDLDDRDRGDIQLLLGRLLLQLGEFDLARDHINAATASLVDKPVHLARALLWLAFPYGSSWSSARHLAALAHATRALPRVSPGPDRTGLLVDMSSVLIMLGKPEGWRLVAEVGDDAPTLVERRQVSRAQVNAGYWSIVGGRYRAATDHLGKADQLIAATGYERLRKHIQVTNAYLDWHTGAWEGLAAKIAGVAHPAGASPEVLLTARLIRASLASARRGRDAQRELGEVLAEARRRGMTDLQIPSAAGLGRLHLVGGRPVIARQVTQPAIDVVTRKETWWWAADLVPVHVQALARSGELAAARVVVRRFAAAITGGDLPAAAAGLLAARAALAAAAEELPAAADGFAAAARAWSALPRPYEELLAAERSARCWLAAGERDKALAALAPVHRRLWELGARRDADRVARLLRRQGVGVARAWRGGRHGYGDRLSPRELEVVRLVSQGLTNPEAAEQLFLSPRTVDRHLSAAMRKFKVSSRTALAVAAAEAGLLDC